MGIFGALTTAVTGMRAQAFALENISGNIANSQTIAFKREELRTYEADKANLDARLPAVREEMKKLKSIDNWDGPVWLDELYELTENIPDVNALRFRQIRNLLTTLFLSQGVPMLVGGDEMGRTQQGNNNAYCQDNEITWFDWENANTALKDFTTRLIAFRRAHPVFRRRRFLSGAEASELAFRGGLALVFALMVFLTVNDLGRVGLWDGLQRLIG